MEPVLRINSDKRPAISRLHDIALRQVFAAFFTPVGFLQPSNPEPHESAWLRELRTKKAVTLVCKEWHDLSLPYLYEEIYICYAWQLPLLERTLHGNPRFFGSLVHGLRLICYVPEELLCVSWDSLNSILDHCSSLRRLSFGGTFTCNAAFKPLWNTNASEGDSSPSFDLLGPLHAREVAGTVTEFAFFDSVPSQPFHDRLPLLYNERGAPTIPVQLIATFPNIVKLSINSSVFGELDAVQPLQLHALEILHIMGCRPSAGLPWRWHMPKLRQLRLLSLSKGGLEASYRDGKKFFEIHGPRIYYLDLGTRPLQWHHVHNVIQLCPSLRRLAVALPRTGTEMASSTDLCTMPPALEYVDIVVDPENPDVRSEDAVNPLYHELAQLWKNVRLIDHSLLHRIPNITDLLPPDEILNSSRSFDLFGVHVTQTSRAIYQQCPHPPMCDWDATFWEFPTSHLRRRTEAGGTYPDSDSDSDFDPGSDTDSEGSTSSSTSSDSDSDYSDADAYEISHDEVQSMIHETRLWDRRRARINQVQVFAPILVAQTSTKGLLTAFDHRRSAS